MANYLIENPTNKLRMIAEVKRDLEPLHFKEPDLRPVNLSDFSRTLYSSSGYCMAAIAAIGTNEPAISKQFWSLRQTIEILRRDMGTGLEREAEATACGVSAGVVQ